MTEMSVSHSSEEKTAFPKVVFYFLPFIFLLLLAFSPLFSALISFAFLLFIGRNLDRGSIFFISIFAMISIVIIYSSRGFYPIWDGSDDVNVYFQNYNDLLNNNYDALFQYGGGIEIGLPLYLFFVGKIFGEVTRNDLLLIVNLPIGISLICWFYIFPAKYIPKHYHALLLAGIVIFYSFSASNLLLRQFAASVILLYSLSVKNRVRAYFFLFISASFHITSIPFYIVYRLYSKRKLGDIYFLILFFFLIFSLSFLGDILSILGLNALSLKLSYYSLNGAGNQDASLAFSLNKATLILLLVALFFIIITKCISMFYLGFRSFSFNRSCRVVAVMFLCTLVSMHLAWFPTRLFLVPVFFLLPIIMFFSDEKRSYVLMLAFFVVLFSQRVFSWFSVDGTYTELWHGYPLWSWVPFYYFF